MPLNISGAIPQQSQFTKTTVKSDYGVHDGYFVGVGEPYKEASNDPCRLCHGSRKDKNGAVCFVCEGSGRRIDTKAALLYDLDNGHREEEIVNFVLTEPRTGKDNKPLSPSTMYVRFRTFSGLKDVNEINRWASELPEKVRIPVQLIIEDNQNATALRISKVLARGANQPAQQQRQQAPAAAQQSEPEYDFPAEDNRF
jgi:hypothetical protein